MIFLHELNSWIKFPAFSSMCLHEFMKVWKLSRIRLKLCTNNRLSLRCWKKISLDYRAQILVLLQSFKDFTYIALKGLLCGIFVYLGSHHIESKSFETLHKSPNHCYLMKELSFDHWWVMMLSRKVPTLHLWL